MVWNVVARDGVEPLRVIPLHESCYEAIKFVALEIILIEEFRNHAAQIVRGKIG
jgi:hypothetical protein